MAVGPKGALGPRDPVPQGRHLDVLQATATVLHASVHGPIVFMVAHPTISPTDAVGP